MRGCWLIQAISEQYGGEPGAGGVVVEAHAHQRHGLDYAEAVGQAPAHEDVVPCRYEDSRSGEGVGGSDERLHVHVCLRRGMAEEGEVRGVSGDAPVALYDSRRPVFDCLCQVDGPLIPMNPHGKSVASVGVAELGGADYTSGDASLVGAALHTRKRLADVKAEGGVERERAVVKGCLNQADSGSTALVGAIDYGRHEFAADSHILHGGIYGDGTDTANRGALVQAIASDNVAGALCYYAIEVPVGKHLRKQVSARFWAGKIAGKAVGGVDGGEGVEADLSAGGCVLGDGGPNHDFRLGFARHR